MFKFLRNLIKRKNYVIILICLALSGCGVTRSRFVPPDTPGGLACVSNCSVLKQECNKEKSRCMSSCSVIEQNCMAANAGYPSRPPVYLPYYSNYSSQIPPTAYQAHSSRDNRRPGQSPAPVQQDCKNSKIHCEEQCQARSLERNCDSDYKECYRSCGGREEYYFDIFGS